MNNRRLALKSIAAAAASSSAMLAAIAANAQTAPAAATSQVIRLGLITSLTGAQAPVGQSMLMGAQIAVDQINAAGGVLGRKLELVTRDDKAKAPDAAVAARELAGAGVNLLLGGASSGVALAVNALLDQEKAVFISCAAHSDRLTKDAFVRNYFRVTDNPYMRARALAKLAAQRFSTVTAWSGLIPDHEYGRSVWGSFEDGLAEFYPSDAKRKATVIAPIRTQFGAADFRGSITSAMALQAEGFLMANFGGDAITLYKQAEPFGLFKKAKLIFDPSNEMLIAKAMKQETPDMWVGAHWVAGAFDNVPMSRAMNAEAVKRTGVKHTDGWTAEGHAGVMAFARGIQAAGKTDTQAVIAAMEGMTFDTATGPRTFRKEDHQAIKDVVLFRQRGSATNPDGFEITEYVRLPGAPLMDTPTPGKAIVLRTVS